MPKAMEHILYRFARRVYLAPSGCWEWRGAVNEHGYGILGRGRRGDGNVKAHRVSYEIHHGVTLEPDVCVCHHCDNPCCVNPQHLFIGSQHENLADMRRKQRDSRPPVFMGTANQQAKLTPEQVAHIRKLSAAGHSSRAVAAQFGISKTAVLSIVNLNTWRHV
jgi:hypothetical protein